MKPVRLPTPVATQALIGLCVAVQAAVALGGVAFGNAVEWQYGLVPARISAAVAGQTAPVPAALTLASHIFLHGGWLHLLLNMIFLAWVGRYVEWVTGRGRLVLLFLVGGIVGGMAQVLADPGLALPAVGASGAVAAVFGTYAVTFARQRVAARRILGLTLSGDVLTAAWYAAVWIGLQLLTGLAFGAEGIGIAIWSHVGGFLTGLLLARPLAGQPPRLRP